MSILEKLSEKKMQRNRPNGTYERIQPSNIPKIIENFTEEFEKQLTLAKLFDNWHGEKVESPYD